MAENGKQTTYDVPDFHEKGKPRCAETDPDMFFPEPDSRYLESTIRIAKDICTRCPYVEECLEWALSHNEIGIWGATTEKERQLIRRRARK